jgi:hypothetical protein
MATGKPKRGCASKLTLAGLAIVVIGVMLTLLGRSSSSKGPIHSADQVFAALDAAGIRHHTNPDSTDADAPNNCGALTAGENRHVRQIYMTQLQVDSDASHDVDFLVLAMDTSSSARTEADSRKSAVQQNSWPAVTHDNLYAEVHLPASQLPPGLAGSITTAIDGITVPASPAPPVLTCP